MTTLHSASPPPSSNGSSRSARQHAALARRSTAETFEAADIVFETCDILVARVEDKTAETRKKICEQFVKARLGITWRHATTFLGVHEKLGPLRERIVAAGVTPTIVYLMASASAEGIETVIARFEAGERPKVAEAKAMLGLGKVQTETVPLADRGGVKALRGHAQDRARRGAANLEGRLLGVLGDLTTGLEPATLGKRVEKGTLGEAIVKPARFARRELTELGLCPVMPDGWDGSAGWIGRESFPEGGWRQLDEVLNTLGGIDDWPKATELVPWLTGTVIPRLLWALDGAVPKELEARIAETLAGIERKRGRKKVAANDDAEAARVAA